MITPQNYKEWCESVKSDTQNINELESKREENFAWFCKELRKEFSKCGDVYKVIISTDGTLIDVIFNGDTFKYDKEVFEGIHCPMKVLYEFQDMTLRIRLYPHTKVEDS